MNRLISTIKFYTSMIREGEEVAYVYILTLRVTGQKYVGRSDEMPDISRWKEGRGYGLNQYIGEVILKYGWEAFDKEIYVVPKRLSWRAEKSLIEELGTWKRDKGFNERIGAEYTLEEREYHSNICSEWWKTDRNHMVANKGRRFRMWNETESYEFNSETQCSKFLRKNGYPRAGEGNISNALKRRVGKNGKVKDYAYGYHFEYIDDKDVKFRKLI